MFKLSHCEFQLIRHHGNQSEIIGRLWSDVPVTLNPNSHRHIIAVRQNGREVLFKSTFEDYKALRRICRKSNRSDNNVRTDRLLREIRAAIVQPGKLARFWNDDFNFSKTGRPLVGAALEARFNAALTA